MTKQSIADWVESHVADKTVLLTGRSTGGLHFDKIADSSWNDRRGKHLVLLACDILLSARAALRGLRQDNAYWPLVIIPVGEVSDGIEMWSENIWPKLGVASEPPSIILMPRPLLLDQDAECYYRPIDAKEIPGDFKCLYTSYRSPELLRRGISEYYNYVYLFFKTE